MGRGDSTGGRVRSPRLLAGVTLLASLLFALGCTGSSDQPDDAAGTSGTTSTTTPAVRELTVRWATTLSGPTQEDEIDGVATAPDGSLYLTGKFERTVTVGGTVLDSAGQADIPLARFDRDGTPLWVVRHGGPGEDNFFDIDADADGAVATGIFEGTVIFGDVTLTSAGGVDCVVAAFTPEGAVRWARSFGGPGIDGCNEVTIGADGSITTSLDTDGGWDSPAGPVPALPWSDSLLLRLDASGEVEWARRVGGDGPQRGKSLAVGPDGSVVFGGDSFGPLVVDDTPLATTGAARDAWLSYWSPDGRLEWSAAWGGEGDDIVKGLAHDGRGIYAVGTVSGDVEIGGTVIAGDGTDDLAVVQLSTDGAVQWATSVDADTPLSGAEIVTAPDGGVLFAGTGGSGVRFRGADGTVTSLDDRAGGTAWLARYRPDGSVGFAATIPGTGAAGADEIARTGDRVYLDVVVRGDSNVAAGMPILADGKDGSVWAIDLPDLGGR